jgi:hypothetical protein
MTTFTRPKLTAEAYSLLTRALAHVDVAHQTIGPFDGSLDPAILLSVKLCRTLLRQSLEAQAPPADDGAVELGASGAADEGPVTNELP